MNTRETKKRTHTNIEREREKRKKDRTPIRPQKLKERSKCANEKKTKRAEQVASDSKWLQTNRKDLKMLQTEQKNKKDLKMLQTDVHYLHGGILARGCIAILAIILKK